MTREAPRWISRALLDAMHEEQRQLHGGNAGALNDGSIESALGRPRNQFHYADADLFECAAAYMFGLAKNHGYHDANKRTAFVTGLTFLRLNGIRISATADDVLRLMVGIATDVHDEAAIAEWLRERSSSLP